MFVSLTAIILGSRSCTLTWSRHQLQEGHLEKALNGSSRPMSCKGGEIADAWVQLWWIDQSSLSKILLVLKKSVYQLWPLRYARPSLTPNKSWLADWTRLARNVHFNTCRRQCPRYFYTLYACRNGQCVQVWSSQPISFYLGDKLGRGKQSAFFWWKLGLAASLRVVVNVYSKKIVILASR